MIGTLYYIEGDKTYTLNDIADAPDIEFYEGNEAKPIPLVNETAEFRFDLTEQRLKIEAMLQEVLGITRMTLDIVRENGHGRIAHLAKHGRKARTRKKNKSRAIRLFKEDT